MILERCAKTGRILSAKQTRFNKEMMGVKYQSLLFSLMLVVVGTAIIVL